MQNEWIRCPACKNKTRLQIHRHRFMDAEALDDAVAQYVFV